MAIVFGVGVAWHAQAGGSSAAKAQPQLHTGKLAVAGRGWLLVTGGCVAGGVGGGLVRGCMVHGSIFVVFFMWVAVWPCILWIASAHVCGLVALASRGRPLGPALRVCCARDVVSYVRSWLFSYVVYASYSICRYVKGP